jgi:hypothetical protein
MQVFFNSLKDVSTSKDGVVRESHGVRGGVSPSAQSNIRSCA